MLDPVERDDIPADAQATPGSGENSPRDILRRLLTLHAAQDTHALADALVSLVASPTGSATACAFVDDGSGLLTPLVGHHEALPGLTDIRLSSAEQGPVAEVLSGGEMVVSDNLEDVLGVEVSGLTLRRALLCRLAWEGETLGVALFCDQGDMDLELYLRLADQVALALVRLRALKRTYRFGGIDPAQWMFDREWLTLRLDEEVERARRYARPLGLLLFRFQNLNQLTEAAGKQQTSVFLRRVAAIIRGQIRTPDILAGYGDASIAVLLPETERAPAIATQERIASHLRQLQPTGAAGIDWTPDLRLGMASHPHDGDTAAELLTIAEGELEQQGDEPQQPLKKTA